MIGLFLPSEIIMAHHNQAAFRVATGAAPVKPQQSRDLPPVMRREVLPVLRVLRRELGLSTGDLLVLDSLLSHLPCRDRKTGEDRPVTPALLLTVFASNTALCERANGMDERVLRRHLARLQEAGLVMRKASATGKRFPLRSGGRITDAFGVDLTPLFQRFPDLKQQSRDLIEITQEIRSVRASALALRSELAACADAAIASRLDDIRKELRRAHLTLEVVRGLLEELQQMRHQAEKGHSGPDPLPRPVSGHRASPEATQLAETGKMSATTGQNVRQVESLKIDNKNPCPMEIWSRCKEIPSFYLEPPGRAEDLIRIIYDFGKMLNLAERILSSAVQRLGLARMLGALDYLATHAARIAAPSAYLEKMIRDWEAGRPVGWAGQ